MNASRRVEIRSQKRLFDDFFKIDEFIVVHQRYDGSMSGAERRLVFERGDAVAVLLFDADARSVVLVEQFRPPPVRGSSPVGVRDPTQLPRTCARRASKRNSRAPNMIVANIRGRKKSSMRNVSSAASSSSRGYCGSPIRTAASTTPRLPGA